MADAIIVLIAVSSSLECVFLDSVSYLTFPRAGLF
jgi:hypothetical protein